MKRKKDYDMVLFSLTEVAKIIIQARLIPAGSQNLTAGVNDLSFVQAER